MIISINANNYSYLLNLLDEKDSYMYQTIGHQLVSCIAKCMGLPLFERSIKGKSLNTNLIYKRTKGDEVEDLYDLLVSVKVRYAIFIIYLNIYK